MKSLRKSLNGSKDNHHHISSPAPLPSVSKPSNAFQPPRKVIRALGSYKSAAPQELSFEKGDFFHVVSDNGGLWYEAHNPMTGSRGLVPSRMFEEFHKGAATPRSPTAASPPPGDRMSSIHTRGGPASPKMKAYYAIVLHDFVAERADELDAKTGDPITVVAQSNREWFVAKPIGRLGRPGLIPVSFVEIRDPTTGQAVDDVLALIDGGGLPRVEEWKRQVLTYKANSISLGVLEDSPTQNNASRQLSPPPPEPTIAVQGATPMVEKRISPVATPEPPAATALPDGILLSAEVKSYHYEMEEYWFRIHALYQPYGGPPTNSLPPAKELVLFRSYNDFYDFQVELLDTFPHEAGRPDTSTRILPYMPGPVEFVDNDITMSRRAELDEYLVKLCALKTYARYILEHILIRQFLALRPGDGEVNVEPRLQELEVLRQAAELNGNGYSDVDPAVDQMSRLGISQRRDDQRSDGSEYEDDGPPRMQGNGGMPPDSHTNGASTRGPPRATGYQHQRTGSASSGPSPRMTDPVTGPRTHIPPQSYSRAHSPASNGRSPGPLRGDPYDSASRSSVASTHDPSSVSMRTSQAGSVNTSSSGRARSQSNAAYTPPISASNPNAAFVKIKIFDRVSDDLVAIRVNPRVTHEQLVDKVQTRLGGNVQALRYRDSASNEFIGLENDEDLRHWLDSTDRHVLYAD